ARQQFQARTIEPDIGAGPSDNREPGFSAGRTELNLSAASHRAKRSGPIHLKFDSHPFCASGDQQIAGVSYFQIIICTGSGGPRITGRSEKIESSSGLADPEVLTAGVPLPPESRGVFEINGPRPPVRGPSRPAADAETM